MSQSGSSWSRISLGLFLWTPSCSYRSWTLDRLEVWNLWKWVTWDEDELRMLYNIIYIIYWLGLVEPFGNVPEGDLRWMSETIRDCNDECEYLSARSSHDLRTLTWSICVNKVYSAGLLSMYLLIKSSSGNSSSSWHGQVKLGRLGPETPRLKIRTQIYGLRREQLIISPLFPVLPLHHHCLGLEYSQGRSFFLLM